MGVETISFGAESETIICQSKMRCMRCVCFKLLNCWPCAPRYMRDKLVSRLNTCGYKGDIDFLYLPIDFRMGSAFAPHA